jgi:hypothetical protein
MPPRADPGSRSQEAEARTGKAETEGRLTRRKLTAHQRNDSVTRVTESTVPSNPGNGIGPGRPTYFFVPFRRRNIVRLDVGSDAC